VKKFFLYLLLIFSVVAACTIIFLGAKSSAEVQEDIKVRMGDVRYLKPKKIKEICGNSTIIKANPEKEGTRIGTLYRLYITLDNGNVLEVNGEQFSKAKVGERCERITED
jgi:lipoprotein